MIFLVKLWYSCCSCENIKKLSPGKPLRNVGVTLYTKFLEVKWYKCSVNWESVTALWVATSHLGDNPGRRWSPLGNGEGKGLYEVSNLPYHSPEFMEKWNISVHKVKDDPRISRRTKESTGIMVSGPHLKSFSGSLGTMYCIWNFLLTRCLIFLLSRRKLHLKI